MIRSLLAPAIVLPLVALFAPHAVAGGDLNGDGFDDLVIGSPRESVSGLDDAGAVTILFGSANGPTTVGAILITADTLGGGFGAVPDGEFGAALAVGDFDGDAFDDLAIGVPGETVSSLTRAGRVVILRGGASGPDLVNPVTWHLDAPGIKGRVDLSIGSTTASNDGYGTSLEAADFDGDGFCDLAIGVPGKDVKGKFSIGAIALMYGSGVGLRAKRNRIITPATKGTNAGMVQFTAFGWRLESGDFNGDGRADLAFVVHKHAFDADTVGGVGIMWGRKKTGITPKGDRLFPVDGDAQSAGVEVDDAMTLCAAETNGDAFDDLVIGTPFEPAGGVIEGGVIRVFRGAKSGLGKLPHVTLTQDSADVFGPANPNGQFGAALAAGDTDGDGFDDLVVGAPGTDVAGVNGAGLVQFMPCGLNGFALANDTAFTQFDMPDEQLEQGDAFGASFAMADYDGDGMSDLAIGVYGEDVGALGDAGCLHVVFGSGSGLTINGSTMTFNEATTGVPGVSEAGGLWGQVLQ